MGGGRWDFSCRGERVNEGTWGRLQRQVEIREGLGELHFRADKTPNFQSALHWRGCTDAGHWSNSRQKPTCGVEVKLS
jgi:hypothetical protein